MSDIEISLSPALPRFSESRWPTVDPKNRGRQVFPGLPGRGSSAAMILRHDTAVARFAHRLALHLIQPALDRKRIRSFPLVRLLLLNKCEQLLHQLNLG